MVPEDLDQKASRLLRETDWGATALAQEIYAILKSGSRRSLVADEPPDTGGGEPAAAEPRGITGSSVALDLGGVGRSIIPVGARLPAGGMGRRRTIGPIAEPDIARPRQMPGVADAARPRRPFDQADPFQVPDFPATEPARRSGAEVGQVVGRAGVKFPDVDTGARVAPLPRPALEGAPRPAFPAPPPGRQRQPQAEPPALERPGFSRPAARVAPAPTPSVPVQAPEGPAGARAAAQATSPPPVRVRPPGPALDATVPPPLPAIVHTDVIKSDDPPVATGHAIWIGVVVSGSGDTYQVDLYQNGMTGASGPEVTVHIPQIDSDETIPEGTVLACIHDYGTGYYECQVPIWLS